MLLIADSGSTKTTWVILKNKQVIKQFNTSGFNPYLQTRKQIFASLTHQLIPNIRDLDTNQINQIYFYGAGCSSLEKNKLIHENLAYYFRRANIVIYHDLIGAAIAVCGKKSGIAAILGTGSNSCKVEDGKIIQSIPSLGLYLGDEGSGGYMGKLFIQNYFYGKFSEEVNHLIEQELAINKETVLNQVYKKPLPNRYLASFTYFISKHVELPEIRNIVHKSFSDFINQIIKGYSHYQSYPLGVVGSVGYIFKDVLQEVCIENQITLGTVIKDPIEGLIKYHAEIN